MQTKLSSIHSKIHRHFVFVPECKLVEELAEERSRIVVGVDHNEVVVVVDTNDTKRLSNLY